MAQGLMNVFVSTDGEQPKAGEELNVNNNVSAKETTDDAKEAANQTAADVSNAVSLQEQKVIASDPKNGTSGDMIFYSAWDPRLRRLDGFMLDENSSGTVVTPFASDSVASSFSDLTFVVEKGVARLMVNSSSTGLVSYNKNLLDLKAQKNNLNSSTGAPVETTTNTNTNSASGILDALSDSDKIVMSRDNEFKYDGKNYGPRSIMNPYSLTKLMGGITNVVPDLFLLNYMYDIRDRRRFYDLAVNQTNGNDPISVHNPTVTNIIRWSNSDKWGRTPYSYQDFVYNKWFGLIPNNRLITFRRYSVPCYDNLNFTAMYGEPETVTDDTKTPPETRINSKSQDPNGTFSPHATVVTYFGGDTGNSLGSFLNFTTGIKWKDIKSQIHNVGGDDGTDPLMTADSLLESPGYGDANTGWSAITPMMAFATKISSKISSFGRFGMAINGPVGQSEMVMMKTYAALNDPYDSGGPFANRIQGPLNRIDSTKAREAGIEFGQSFLLKVSYTGKSIGGINPKAALLDCLGNAMEMVSPTAVFWGGGHRFEINPHTYPFHNGGWRGSYLEAIYNGKFLGNNGALSIIGSGIKKFATGDDGQFDPAKLTGNITGGIGSILGAISAGISALGSAIGIGGIGDALSAASNWLSGKATSIGGADAVSAGASHLSTLVSNVGQLWHDKCLQETTFPTITNMGALLSGEPVGEWHLTIGNPLNPIMVCGNLICSKMEVEWDEELGPDDFPNGFSVKYTIEHGMERDKDAILSMFNKGMGRYYVLPDYIRLSSDMETSVDHFTGGVTERDGDAVWLKTSAIKKLAREQGVATTGYHKYNIQGGTPLWSHANPNTLLVTNFTPSGTANTTLDLIRSRTFTNESGNMPIIRALAATVKMVQ